MVKSVVPDGAQVWLLLVDTVYDLSEINDHEVDRRRAICCQ